MKFKHIPEEDKAGLYLTVIIHLAILIVLLVSGIGYSLHHQDEIEKMQQEIDRLRAGVPGVFVCGGQDWIDPEDHRRHFNPPYHHPKDEWREDWDMSGVMDQWNLIHALIEAYADDDQMPRWLPGSGFSRPSQN